MAVLLSRQSSGHPANSNILLYLAYWTMLGVGQGGLLFYVYRHRLLSARWAIVTTLAGMGTMLLHDLCLYLMGVDTGGQGVVILLLSLPILALLGGWCLGLAQWFVLRRHLTPDRPIDRLAVTWAIAAFFAWAIGFVGLLFAMLFAENQFSWIGLPIFTAIGTFIKGIFIATYLKYPRRYL
jgi:hypothetical protein